MKSTNPSLSRTRNPRHATQYKKLAIIVLAWLVIGFLVSVYDHLSVHSEISAGPAATYSFTKNLIFNMLAAFMGSFIGGIWLIFYVNEKLRTRTYGQTLLTVALSFFVIVFFIAVVLGFFIVKYDTGAWPFIDDLATTKYFENLTNLLHLKNIIIWSNITLLTQIMLQVNDKFGQGLMWDFIRGKYHSPIKEKRIFMFLDITSSTAIAEKLGNEDYYEFIRDFYADITNSILNNGGVIYQYVGDEVVISWPCQNEAIDDYSVNCYFDIRKKIDSLKDKYINRFGVAPDFKAALHFGFVTAGEIGIIKKDITYSGDVLNTTARILSKCNQHKQKLLVSENLFQHLLGNGTQFNFKKIGEDILRGKSETIAFYGVTERGNVEAEPKSRIATK